MTSGLALLAYWSVRRNLNCVSSVQFSYVAPVGAFRTNGPKDHLLCLLQINRFKKCTTFRHIEMLHGLLLTGWPINHNKPMQT